MFIIIPNIDDVPEGTPRTVLVVFSLVLFSLIVWFTLFIITNDSKEEDEMKKLTCEQISIKYPEKTIDYYPGRCLLQFKK